MCISGGSSLVKKGTKREQEKEEEEELKVLEVLLVETGMALRLFDSCCSRRS